MSAFIKKTSYLFGIVEPKPVALPLGWEYLEDRHSFLRCVAPDASRYFVRSDGLQRAAVATQADVDRTATPDGGGLRLGQDYISGELIPFPTV